MIMAAAVLWCVYVYEKHITLIAFCNSMMVYSAINHWVMGCVRGLLESWGLRDELWSLAFEICMHFSKRIYTITLNVTAK